MIDHNEKDYEDAPAGTAVDRIDAVRRDAMIAETVEIEMSRMRHPANRGKGQK